MSRFVGVVTDISYHQEYLRIKGNRIYYYRICPICQEELEKGFSDLDSGGRTGTLPHICEDFKELAKKIGTKNLPKIRFEWGQFYNTKRIAR